MKLLIYFGFFYILKQINIVAKMYGFSYEPLKLNEVFFIYFDSFTFWNRITLYQKHTIFSYEQVKVNEVVDIFWFFYILKQIYTVSKRFGFPYEGRKEGNVLFMDTLNTFYLQLHGVRHMVMNHSDS